MKKFKPVFITSTDTGVGKTITTYLIGSLLKKMGYDVGVMKPVQCSGSDAEFLKKSLLIKDNIKEINPFFAKKPLSPNVAFKYETEAINLNKIINCYEKLKERHEILLVEGAGGLLVPLFKNYFIKDLIKELGADVVIVSRSGLGTINHTLLTIENLRNSGINIKGVIFNETANKRKDVPAKTNPDIIRTLGGVKILGTIPYLKSINKISRIDLNNINIDVKNLLTHEKTDTGNLVEWDKKYIWHPFTQMKDWLTGLPLIIDHAKGCYLIDINGKKYLDGISSLWVNVHGHRKKEIDEAVKKQIDKVSHSTLLGLSNVPSIQLAKKLIEIAPKGLEKVFYSDSGSTSVEIAIKIAYQYWQNAGRHKKIGIVHVANSYHGDTLGSVSVGGMDLFHKVYRNLIFKAIKFDFPDCYRSEEGKKYPQYAFEYLKNLENLFKEKGETIAAFIAEPIVQGAAGMIMWPKGILRKMCTLCKKYNIIFIADEVATGFGRTGKMFACEHENVVPDIMCVAKGLTGGYLPLAATLTTKKIFDGFVFNYNDKKTFFHGHTYTGNPLCCAAALANIALFQKEKVLDKTRTKIKFLRDELKKFKSLKYAGDVRQKGLMVGIEMVRDKRTKEPFLWDERIGVNICERMREKGIILRPLGNVIVLMPPLSVSKKELKKILNALYETINEYFSEFYRKVQHHKFYLKH